MKIQVLSLSLSLFVLVAFGCSKAIDKTPNSDPVPAAEQQKTAPPISSERNAELQKATAKPEDVVFAFLDSVFKGNTDEAQDFLTAQARVANASANGLPFGPPTSKDATFSIDKVDFNGDETAYVQTTLTDFDQSGKKSVDPPIFWGVRKTEDGWRIAGAAVKYFENQPPIILNFENPDEMKSVVDNATKTDREMQFAEAKKRAEANLRNQAGPQPQGFGDVPVVGSTPGTEIRR